jgi:predicted transcriptional regulator YdeE
MLTSMQKRAAPGVSGVLTQDKIMAAMKCSWILLAASVLALLLGTTMAEDALKPRAVTRQGFEVIGAQARTSVAKELSDSGEIPKLWKRLYTDGITDKISGKVGDSIISLYTDFSGADWNQEYTVVLGTEVKRGAKPPAGMVAVHVPAGKYMEFTTQKGALNETVPKLWRQITQYFAQPGAPQRAFTTDYEVYDADMEPQSAIGKIYVSVK